VTVLRKAEAEDGTSASRRTRVRERGKGESVRGEASVRLAGKQRQTRLRCAAGREGLDLTRLLLSPDDFDFVESANRIMALPAAYSEMLAELNGGLKGVMTGVEVGVRRGDDFVPSHALAMSTQLNPDAFLRYEVSVEEAISYLRRGTVTPVDAPGGYLLLTFGGEPLGFVKHLVSRANNLYPGEWRIRSGYLPERGVDIFTLPVPPPGS
jgi:NOL1/NOP2/fmu family ribosome biogenesis protein